VLASRPHRRRLSKFHLTLLFVPLLMVMAGAWGGEAAAAESDPDLVAAYSFDEGAGSVAHDSVGTHDGDFKNGTVWTSAGKYGGAVSFDGVDDLITVPAAADLNLSKTFTIEAWVRPDTLTPYDTMLTKEAAGSKTFSLIPEGDHVAPKFEVAKTASSMNTINATSQLPLNAWSHVALTFNGETLRLYVNGSQVTTIPQSTLYNAEGPLQIGGNLVHGEHFDGSVDEIRIYNRTLSATEVKGDGEAAVGWNPQSRLVAAYSFDEGSGTVAHDAVGAHDGTLEKGAGWTSAGKFGAAINFNGLSGEQVTIPDSDDLDFTGPFTIEAWVRPDKTVEWGTVLEKQRGTGINYQLVSQGDHNAPVGYIQNTEKEWGVDGGTTPLPASTWSHIAFTSDGSTLKFYVNGQLKGSDSTGFPAAAGTGPLVIGGGIYDGLIDEIRLYRRTLSGTEVGQDKEAALGGEWPSTTVDFGAEGLVGYSEPVFGYGSNDPEATFQCRFDAAAYVACNEDEFLPASPLADGAHTFSVRAVDAAGHADGTPATRSFTVDATAPTATVTGGPEGPTSSSSPTFTFSEAGGAATCAIRTEGSETPPTFGGCTTASSYSVSPALANGSYAFMVKSVDSAENETSAVRSFSVDTVAPQTTIVSAPPTTTDDPKPTFGFTASESAVSFTCRFDSAAFVACSGSGTHAPATALADGFHSFEVRALDAAGNLDSTPAQQVFVVKTTGPQTTIATGPSGGISATAAKFTYSANKTATFECRLDAAAFAACGTSKEYIGLAEGAHSFEVRAVASGIADPTPARKEFIVDTSLPATPVVSGALKNSSQIGMTLQVEAKDGDTSTAASTRSGVASIRVKVDGKLVATAPAPCTSNACAAAATRTIQLPYQEAVGTHQLTVESQDGVGHFSAPVEWTETASSSKELRVKARGPRPPNCPTPYFKVRSEGKVIPGSECPDLIVVSGRGKHVIYGFEGNDVILGGPATDIVNAGGGDDFIRTRRSNDVIRGGAGNDTAYGGTGDDKVLGGANDDILDGGPGGDEMEGAGGNDTLRGGQGNNHFTGGAEEDTFSFSDAVSPGFRGTVSSSFTGFPGSEAGVKINLETGQADNGEVAQGGQEDRLHDHPERIVGSAWSDYIIGTTGFEKIDGGPGADLIDGKGGSDEIALDPYGRDFRVGEGSRPFSASARAVGSMEVGVYGSGAEVSAYLDGSNGRDQVGIDRHDGSVQFVAANSTVAGRFAYKEPTCTKSGNTVTCSTGTAKLGPLVAYGDDGADNLSFADEEVSQPGAYELLGGDDTDRLVGGSVEDLLVDGLRQRSGVERLLGNGGDDALLQNSRADISVGGKGNDLLVNGSICWSQEALYGDETNGSGGGADNGQFRFVEGRGVKGNLVTEKVGEVGGNCNKGKLETLSKIETLEGSNQGDVFTGDGQNNLLLGRGGRDTLSGEGGADTLHGFDNLKDQKIDCGAGTKDVAHIDKFGTPNDRSITEHCETTDEDAREYGERPWIGVTETEGDDSPLAAEEAAPALLDYYRLDESSETSAANGASEGGDGTYKAIGYGPSVNGPGPSLGVSGSLVTADSGTGVAFDGVDDFVDLGAEGTPAGGNSAGFSVALLAKFDRAPGAKEFLFSAGDSAGGAFLYRDAVGKIVFSSGLTVGAPEVTSAIPINDGTWHHLAGTLKGEEITLFVDGFPYSLGYGSSVMPKVGSEDQSQVAASPSLSQLFDGTVDEVMTYEGALNEAQISEQIAESMAEEPETLLAAAAEADSDGDGVFDGEDNCPAVSNASQADADLNGEGDACDAPDTDGDGIVDASDNCLSIYNPAQADTDGNGMGDECASMPPTVVTEAASSITSTTATFNAKIDPEGLATTYRFEYGKTTAYGSAIPATAKSAGSGISSLPFGEAVAGLSGATTYHYRVVATNPAGKSIGADRTFTTP
jgi:Ca2+-binding RTX toxin-like protein